MIYTVFFFCADFRKLTKPSNQTQKTSQIRNIMHTIFKKLTTPCEQSLVFSALLQHHVLRNDIKHL